MQLKSILTMAAVAASTAAMAQAPAFPGAEGHGRYVTGGRGGKVIHVTNLNDKGEGSFRAAVTTSGKKIIVFDVAGVIPLASDVKISANTTILGQTAPYPGITLRYYTVTLGGNNTIVRFLRFRRGQEKNVNDGADTFWGRNLTGAIIDHCSMSWSIDEIGSFYDNNNFTMQWCVYGESLNNAGHDKGAHGYGGIWGGKLASFHHNMIAHTSNRAPRFNGARYNWTGYTSNSSYNDYKWENAVQAENVDFRNCLIFDWGSGGCYGGPGGGYINMVNNYYKSTPETNNKNRITQVSIANSTTSSDENAFMDMTSRYFISGNYVNGYGANYDWSGVKYDSGIPTINGEYYTLDSLYAYGKAVEHVNNSKGIPCVKIKLDEAKAPIGEVTTHSAENAYQKILTYGGASLFRDDVDARYMTETQNGSSTYTGSVTKVKGRIDVVADCDGYTEKNFPTGEREKGFDTDNDGMPDVWENANGLNPNDASDALTYTLDSKGYYTNLEVYANALVEDIMKGENTDAESSVDEYYPTVNKVEGIDYYTGREVERVDPADTSVVIDGAKGSITWPLTSGNIETATIADNITAGIQTTSMSLGSGITLNSTKNVNGTTETLFQAETIETGATENNYAAFTITPKEGFSFQPTNIAFRASKIGTNKGTLKIAYLEADGTETDIATIEPNRNEEASSWYTDFDQTILCNANEKAHQFKFYFYNLGNLKDDNSINYKQIGLSNLVITGTVVNTTTGISQQVSVSTSPIQTIYYNMSGQRISAPVTGQITIAKTLYENGTVKTRKIIQ